VIECVPNLSEGRDPNTVERIADVVRSEGCRVLDIHTDVDHNRAVLTIVGEPGDVVRGMISMVEAAIPLIDIHRHEGAHPRIGAVDVVPFVPLESSSLAQCVTAAKDAGAAIGEVLGIPVYLYEAAATRPEFRNLADVRRGGLRGLAERVEDGERGPDFGPAHAHPTAGAVAVGARKFLVAYNVNLETDNLEVARTIASTIRAASDGLPGAKALGIPLHSRGLVQVSMNLTDVEATSVVEAFDRVAELAARHGIRVLESEIVGLAPRVALREATTEKLLLTRDLADVVLEERIEER
jgi:glutamate formiminotransferase